MRIKGAVIAVFVLLGLLVVPALAQQPAQPPAQPAQPAQQPNPQKKAMQLSGEIVSVNAADSSVTVRSKDDASSTFKVNATTQIVREGKTIKLEELASGEKVSVTYEKQAQANVAVMIGVMASGKA
jgi:hypothetical protein